MLNAQFWTIHSVGQRKKPKPNSSVLSALSIYFTIKGYAYPDRETNNSNSYINLSFHITSLRTVTPSLAILGVHISSATPHSSLLDPRSHQPALLACQHLSVPQKLQMKLLFVRGNR